MSEITAEMIKTLRERTGIGIGKCKSALEAAGGDIEKAISDLRKAGVASAVKKEGRITNEGMVGVARHGDIVGVVEVNAETDFVVKNDRFQKFVQEIVNEIAKTNPSSLEAFLKQKSPQDKDLTVDEYRGTFVQTIGENIQIKRLKTVERKSGMSVGVYSHLGGKIVTVVEIEGSEAEEALAADIAMHAAAESPEYLSEETVPKHIIEHEKDIAASQVKGKPANMLEKILEGKLRSFYDASCLLRQKFIKDDSVTIDELVANRAKATGKNLVVKNFTRWQVSQ